MNISKKYLYMETVYEGSNQLEYKEINCGIEKIYE